VFWAILLVLLGLLTLPSLVLIRNPSVWFIISKLTLGAFAAAGGVILAALHLKHLDWARDWPVVWSTEMLSLLLTIVLGAALTFESSAAFADYNGVRAGQQVDARWKRVVHSLSFAGVVVGAIDVAMVLVVQQPLSR
jgi:uncharacterized membrane protein HdeD (DUF308 family)